jgi:hypothetical protein
MQGRLRSRFLPVAGLFHNLQTERVVLEPGPAEAVETIRRMFLHERKSTQVRSPPARA